ncbi:MAG: histidine phosphatase family protein [Firmicutes bacterium]|nr:histidine phosphatase family protein [Bacillota bacterium]
MKIYLISNNLLLDGLSYDSSANLELIRMIRPLSVNGEQASKKISEMKEFQNIEKIYSSFHSTTLSAAKYLSNKLELPINMDERLNDCKVGILGSKNIKMVKGLQDHEFSYKLPSGESLNDVGNRINNFIKEVCSKSEECVILSHKRAILGFLLKHSKVGYNLDDNLILEYNGKLIYDDSESDIDIYELTIENREIVDVNKL